MRSRLAMVAIVIVPPIAAPARAATPPPGATAICRDHTYSYSHHRRGTCSHHHGVAKWLRHVPP